MNKISDNGLNSKKISSENVSSATRGLAAIRCRRAFCRGFSICPRYFLAVSGGICSSHYVVVIGSSLFAHESYLYAVVLAHDHVYLLSRPLCGDFLLLDAAGAADQYLPNLAIVCLTTFMLLLAVAFSLKVSDEYSRIWLYSFGQCRRSPSLSFYRLIGCLPLSSLIILPDRGICTRKIVVLGGGKQTEQLLRQLENEKPTVNKVDRHFR